MQNISNNLKTEKISLDKLKDKQFISLKGQENPQPRKKQNYFFKNSENQQACCLAIGPQNSGKTTLFENIFKKLFNKKSSFLFLISSLPKRELEQQIKDLDIKDPQTNTITYSHNSEKNQDCFKDIYETMSNYMDEFYQGKDLFPQKSQLLQQLEMLLNQKKLLKQQDKNIKNLNQINNQILDLEQKIKKIGFYQENKDVQIKFFIFVDDLLKLKSYQIPFFELILRNYRHLGGVFLYVTAQAVMVIPRQLRDLFTHLILFGNIPIVRMQQISEQQKLPISEELLLEIYQKETKQPHSYIIICAGNGIKAIQTKENIYLFY